MVCKTADIHLHICMGSRNMAIGPQTVYSQHLTTVHDGRKPQYVKISLSPKLRKPRSYRLWIAIAKWLYTES